MSIAAEFTDALTGKAYSIQGTVAIMKPDGEVVREVEVLGKAPSNLCFGGPDGRTVYVTEVEHTRLVQFRVERPGLEWERAQNKK